MKKVWAILPLVLLLGGCGSAETLETISDEWLQPVMATPRNISVRLPDEAAAPVMETDTELIYLCEDYEIVLETMSSGDLGKTIQHICGYEKENLTIMHTGMDGVERYEFVWASAGETGEQLGRAVILDDGQYHYCLSALRDAAKETVTQAQWNDVFRSFQLN